MRETAADENRYMGLTRFRVDVSDFSCISVQAHTVLVCVRGDCLSVHQALHEYAYFAMRRPPSLLSRATLAGWGYGRSPWQVYVWMYAVLPMNQVRIPRDDANPKTCATSSLSTPSPIPSSLDISLCILL